MSGLVQTARALFADAFGAEPVACVFAPGRVNLLGEHTDYNGGFVLPMPLTLGTAVALGFGGAPGAVAATSAVYDGVETRTLADAPSGGWTDYIVGSLREARDLGLGDRGVRLAVAGDLPVGAGLSSSAALEVAVLRAVTEALGAVLTPVEIAVRARRAENDYVGMPCGIMDQFSVSVGVPGSALFLDTRTLEHRAAPLPDTHRFVVVHSGVGHKLTEAGYSERVRECQAAVSQLGVGILSDLSHADLDRVAGLPPPLDGRARHIITENDRVLRGVDALTAGDISTFGQLMIESHNSQRDDYEVSVPQVDALVEGALAAGAEGARLTGGGFGGSIVALVKTDRIAAFEHALTAAFPQARVSSY